MSREETVKDNILYAAKHLDDEDRKLATLQDMSLSLAIICDFLRNEKEINDDREGNR